MEFVRLMVQIARSQTSEEQLVAAFRVLDK